MKKLLILIVAVFILTGCNPFAKKAETDNGGGIGKKAKSYTYQSLKTAVKLGIPLKCSYKVGEFEYEGYIKGKQWRGKMTQMDKTTNIIMKDNCMYAWADDTQEGTKMCFEEDIWESEDNQFEQPAMEYICVPSLVGDDKFTPPSSVNFMDLDNINPMMQQPMNQQMPENFPTDEMMKSGLPIEE